MTTLRHLRFQRGLVYDDTPLVLPGITVHKEVGRGANGLVVEATEAPLNRRVAVKVWDRKLDSSDHGRALDEARSLARFVHPLLVTVHRFDAHDLIPYAVFEYVDGVTAEEWRLAADRTVAERVAVWIMYRTALEYIHEQGALHGDPHTKNVLVFPDVAGAYRHFYGAYSDLRIGMKITDLGASFLRPSGQPRESREAQVILETGTRLWQGYDPHQVLDLGAENSIPFAFAVFESWAVCQESLLRLRRAVEREDDYGIDAEALSLSTAVARVPVYDPLAVLERIDAVAPARAGDTFVANLAAAATHYRDRRSSRGGFTFRLGTTRDTGSMRTVYGEWRDVFLADGLSSQADT